MLSPKDGCRSFFAVNTSVPIPMPGNTSQLNNHKVKAIALNIAAFLTKKIAHFFESLSHTSK